MNHGPKAENAFLNSLKAERDFPFSLGSDNHAGVHPRILASLATVNDGFAPSYGTDLVCTEAENAFRALFGSKTEVHFCFNGTAANVLSLSLLVRPHHTILMSNHAHLFVDECGAGERLLGAKLIAIPTQDADGAKLSPAALEPYVIRRGDQHFSQVAAVSITQPTELGTLYSKDELQAIVAYCRQNNLWLHMDGARFILAAAGSARSLEEAKQRLRDLTDGVDVLSFGGTKNGLLFGEAVVFLSDRAREANRDFRYSRKQLMQLPSKTRFIAAQFLELVGTSLWFEIASHSCQLARRLREGLTGLPGVEITQPSQANAVFAIFPRELEKRLRDAAFFYVWNEHTRECRLMTSWQTSTKDVDDFIAIARKGRA